MWARLWAGEERRAQIERERTAAKRKRKRVRPTRVWERGGGRETRAAEGSVVRNATLVPSGRCIAEGKISQSPAVWGRRTFRARVSVWFRVWARDTEVIAINRGEVWSVVRINSRERSILNCAARCWFLENSVFPARTVPEQQVCATLYRNRSDDGGNFTRSKSLSVFQILSWIRELSGATRSVLFHTCQRV